MDKIEAEIVQIILKNSPLRAIEIARLLKTSRQQTEYYLKRMCRAKTLERKNWEFYINFKTLFESQSLITISDKEQIKMFIEFMFTQVAGVRAYFIEPWQPIQEHKTRTEFDIMLDRVFSDRNVVYEGIVENGAVDIFKHYPISELEKERQRLYVAYSLDRELILPRHTFYAIGDFVTELDYNNQEIKVQKNAELANMIEMTVKMGKHFGQRVNINSEIESIKVGKKNKSVNK